jgi:hypothetical protein
LRGEEDVALVVNDGERANWLNEYFGSVGTVDDGTTPENARAVPDSASVDSVDFSAVQVLSAIR